MKTIRQVAILDIIEKQDVETQEELADALRQRGIKVTQATVSRDAFLTSSSSVVEMLYPLASSGSVSTGEGSIPFA